MGIDDPETGAPLLVDASDESKSRVARYASYSHGPNAEFVSTAMDRTLVIALVALRRIDAWEEVTANYGPTYCTYEVCYCGEPNCTGFIGGPPPKKRRRGHE
jgi:histone-lysine N-methyltransferase SETD2